MLQFIVASAKPGIHFFRSWSIRMLNLWPSKYVLGNKTGQTTAKQSQCVVSYLFSAAFSVLHQKLSGLVVRMVVLVSKHSICFSSTVSLAVITRPLDFGKESTDADTRLSCSLHKVSGSSCKRFSNVLRSFFLIWFLGATEMQAKLQKAALRKLRKDWNVVWYVKVTSPKFRQ